MMIRLEDNSLAFDSSSSSSSLDDDDDDGYDDDEEICWLLTKGKLFLGV